MSLDYLKFVEEHRDYAGFNEFEKVLMAARRAKDIYEVESTVEQAEEQNPANPPKKRRKSALAHKPTYRAILEINERRIYLLHGEDPALTKTAEAESAVDNEEPANALAISD